MIVRHTKANDEISLVEHEGGFRVEYRGKSYDFVSGQVSGFRESGKAIDFIDPDDLSLINIPISSGRDRWTPRVIPANLGVIVKKINEIIGVVNGGDALWNLSDDIDKDVSELLDDVKPEMQRTVIFSPVTEDLPEGKMWGYSERWISHNNQDGIWPVYYRDGVFHVAWFHNTGWEEDAYKLGDFNAPTHVGWPR